MIPYELYPKPEISVCPKCGGVIVKWRSKRVIRYTPDSVTEPFLATVLESFGKMMPICSCSREAGS